jgi:hypothetical protein
VRILFLASPIIANVALDLFYCLGLALSTISAGCQEIITNRRATDIKTGTPRVLSKILVVIISTLFFIIISYAGFNGKINPIDLVLYLTGFILAAISNKWSSFLIYKIVMLLLNPLIFLFLLFERIVAKILKWR